jgi:uncharacterized protein YlxW (UPF0749 family)
MSEEQRREERQRGLAGPDGEVTEPLPGPAVVPSASPVDDAPTERLHTSALTAELPAADTGADTSPEPQGNATADMAQASTAERAQASTADTTQAGSAGPAPAGSTDPAPADSVATEANPEAPGPSRTPESAPPPAAATGVLARLRGSRASGAGILIAVLVGLLGFALVAQVNSNQNASSLSSDRPDDLVRILSDLDARKDRLNTEISSLQQTQQELQSGAAGKQAALAEAAKRADDLGILAGTIAAEGPGLRITLSPGNDPIGAADVLDVVEELRGAGAEAMEIGDSRNGATVRVVASTYFIDADDGIAVDSHKMGGTLTLTVIGDPQTMQTALSIPGGAVDTVKQHGGNVTMASPGTVRVTALRQATTPKYAQPAS